jgi:hypothetical protein
MGRRTDGLGIHELCEIVIGQKNRIAFYIPFILETVKEKE